MTRVVYEPELPAIEFDGHAGAGLRGRDPVCAALSILLFTLVEGVEGAQIRAGDAYCRVRGGDKASYALIAAGLRLLAREYPQNAHLEVKT